MATQLFFINKKVPESKYQKFIDCFDVKKKVSGSVPTFWGLDVGCPSVG